jgi:hypothetical protein
MMRRFLSNEKNTEGVSAKELHSYIKAHVISTVMVATESSLLYLGLSST